MTLWLLRIYNECRLQWKTDWLLTRWQHSRRVKINVAQGYLVQLQVQNNTRLSYSLQASRLSPLLFVKLWTNFVGELFCDKWRHHQDEESDDWYSGSKNINPIPLECGHNSLFPPLLRLMTNKRNEPYIPEYYFLYISCHKIFVDNLCR